MKKIIYIILLSLCASLSFTSCTEEEVRPSVEEGASGGTGSGGKV